MEIWSVLLKFINNLGEIVRKAVKTLYDCYEGDKSL